MDISQVLVVLTIYANILKARSDETTILQASSDGTSFGYCLPSTIQSLQEEPASPILANSYSVEVEMTVEGLNATVQAQQVVDNPGNRAVVTVLNQGQQLKLLYNYNTLQVLYITDDNCTVHNLTNDVARFAFFGISIMDNRAHILDGPSTLYFGDTIPKKYVGRSTIRGIDCDCWQACLTLPEFNINFTINYFFAVRDWMTPSQFQQMPVRYDINGTQVYSNGTIHTFRRTYNFFNYLPDVDSDSTLFQTDEGVVCNGQSSTRAMPPLSSHYFQFSQEIVDVYQGVISQADVWYDLDSKLVRLDYRSPEPIAPLFTTNPVSEVHDYNYGVRYVRDLLSGQCTAMAMFQEIFDAKVDTSALRINGSFVMNVKNPISFFFLDSNFTYVGQRTTRDALCDVFISHRYDYDLHNNGSAYEATVEIYFLAEGWMEVANHEATDISQQFPIKLHLWIPKVDYNLIYHLYDFNTERPDISIFDVADCYNDSKSLHFRVRFPGPFSSDTAHMVLVKGQNALANSMQVSPLRVSRVHIDYDASYLYLSAYLLGRTPSIVQFTQVAQAVTEIQDDASWGNVESAAACSDLCVNSPDMVCLSFLYCPADRNACRLSRQHISSGQPTLVKGTCDLYSRTVDMRAAAELTIKEAFSNLQQAIKQNTLSFDVPLSDQDIPYIAVDAEIVFGELRDSVSRPSLTGQFSYRVEIVYTRHSLVNTYDVWYDSPSRLIRVDRRDAAAGPPYYSPFTITTIHDFNTGVAYNVDGTRGNCTVTPIPIDNANGFHQPVNLTAVNTTGIEILTLKSPDQMFYLDADYIFTGQKTVRGIMCNVFESKRTDFTIGSTSEHSIFQYFFQAQGWAYEADSHADITLQQPVQLTILDYEENEFMMLNFYNFNDESTSLDHFNIAPCFTDDQKIEFLLQFNQSYHPYLDTQQWQFRQQLKAALSQGAKVSPLRLQNMQVTYNMDTTFVIATLLGQVSAINHFRETGQWSPRGLRMTGQDVAGCAASCYYSRLEVCNSFYYCPDHTCYLSTYHGSTGATSTQPPVLCQHFSRLVNGTSPEALLEDAFTTIKDLVFKRLINISLSGSDGSQAASFLATGIRDDVFLLTQSWDSGATDLSSKFRLYQTGAEMSGTILQQTGLAVDDCATACISQISFICQTFTYCYTSAKCYLGGASPDTNTSLVTSNAVCDLYTRRYLDSYNQYDGQVIEGSADSTLHVTGAENCARQCTLTSTFTCRSFDLCTDGSCLLHRQHMVDLNGTANSSASCTHYSRSYLPDFTVARRTVLNGVDKIILDGVTPSVCAYRCSTYSGQQCQGFEFCRGQCRLLSSKPTSIKTAFSADCDLYSFPEDSWRVVGSTTSQTTRTSTTSFTHPSTSTSTLRHTTAPATEYVNTQERKSGASETGTRAGIGLGAAAAGMLMGAVVVLAVHRVRSRGRDEGSMELLPDQAMHH